MWLPAINPAKPLTDDHLNNGLVSRFKVLPNQWYGGTQWRNLVRPNPADVVAQDAATWSRTGRRGAFGKITMDGSNDYWDGGNLAKFQITGALTLSCWVSATSPASNPAGMISKYIATGNQRGYSMNMSTAGLLTFAISGDGTAITNIAGTSDISGSWHHALAVYKPSTSITVFVDGVQQATNTTSIPAAIFNNTATFKIGHFGVIGGVSGYYLNGSLDDCCIWNRALSAYEIEDVYTCQSTPFDRTINWYDPRMAVPGTVYNLTGSGGSIAGGSGIFAVGIDLSALGGATTAGAADLTATMEPSSTGGASTGGTADPAATVAIVAAGGAATGGEASPIETVTLTATGGAVTGGAASPTVAFSIVASGGVVTGGAATVSTSSVTPDEPADGWTMPGCGVAWTAPSSPVGWRAMPAAVGWTARQRGPQN